MWIWELPDANHGNIASIVASARQYGVNTLLIKSSDGTDMWSQFNSQLVQTLHANGLHVCAWQYVYGTHPATEADLGAAAVQDGADCLLIDAESEYEGKYISAQTYMTRPAGQGRRQLPARAGRLPVRRLPPRLPVFGVPGAGGRPVQRAADVLEGHPDHHRRRLRPHLRVQPDLPAADLPARAGLRPPSGPPDLPLPPALPGLRRQRRQLVGLAGGDPVGVDRAVASRGHRCTATSRTRSWPRSRRARPAISSCGRRST